MKVFLLFFFSTQLFAGSIHLDLEQVETNFNSFSIPKDVASEIRMPTEGTLSNVRLTGFFDLPSKNQLYFLLAPLESDYNFTSSKAFTFNNTNFLTGTNTDVTYKFNSYRIGYMWTWESGRLRYWLGAVGKIRDAKITVTQGATTDSFDNVGFVPLASFGFEYALTQYLRLFSHSDALGASQGSAYDIQLELKWRVSRFAISFGKRILGGGADNETVFNFAQFDTHYLRVSTYF
jgi:hypothetical protein